MGRDDRWIVSEVIFAAIRGGWPVLLMSLMGCGDGLKDVRQYERGETPPVEIVSDTRQPVELSDDAGGQHREVMLQHVETLQQILGALAEGNFMLAQMQAHAHADFFGRRMQMVGTRIADYPSNFGDLTRAHQAATQVLADSIPTKDFGRILPALNGVLKACTACHRVFTLRVPPQR